MQRFARSYLFASLICLAIAAGSWAADLSIKQGDQVVRVAVTTEEQLKLLKAMDLDVWSHEIGVGPVDVHVSTTEIKRLEAAGLTYQVLNPDLQRTRQEEEEAYRRYKEQAARGLANPFDSYLPLPDIIAFINNLAAARPDLCEVVDIGNSVEGRDIWVLHITGTGADPKPGVFYHGLQHAREWITAPTVLYLADHLVNNYDTDVCIRNLVDSTDFYLAPCVNPDGYTYTWGPERLWRKNRRNNGGSFGVDLNRNWGYQWGYDNNGSSPTPSEDTYRGPSPFSEPETQALRDFINAHPNIRAYMDYHSYSQLILWPFGYENVLAPEPDRTAFNYVGGRMHELIEEVHGQFYEPGPIWSTIYPANGGSADWVYGGAGRFGFSIELRDTGAFGFTLPASQIIPNCEENLPAILFLSRWASAGILLDLQGPAPAQIIAEQSTPISVSLNAAQENYVPGSGLMHYRFNPADPYSTTPLVLQSGTNYIGTLPAGNCGDTAEFYFTASGSGGFAAVDPCGAPTNIYSAPVTLPEPTPELAYSFTMTANPGWALGTGWAYGDPTGSCGDPQNGFTGTNVVGYNLSGCYTNNIPARYATTTAIDCSNLVNTQLRFRRWLGLESSQYDHATIQASNNGTTWTTIWDYVGPTISETSWSLQTYDISAVADEQPTVFIRWGMGPSDPGVVGCGWNIDDVEILGADANPCGGFALGDVNNDTLVDAMDIGAFTEALLQWPSVSLQQTCSADIDGVCGVTMEDVEPFVQLLVSN
jgi:murein tripeptide amidase MpaA